MYSLKLIWLLSKSVLAFTAHLIFFANALRIKAGLSSCRRRIHVGVGLDLLQVVDKNVDIGMAGVEHRVEKAMESFWAAVGLFLPEVWHIGPHRRRPSSIWERHCKGLHSHLIPS